MDLMTFFPPAPAPPGAHYGWFRKSLLLFVQTVFTLVFVTVMLCLVMIPMSLTLASIVLPGWPLTAYAILSVLLSAFILRAVIRAISH